MLFNSLLYACFLPVVVLVYFLAPRRARVWVLLVASYVFYASWDVRFLPLIVGLTALNFALALAIHRWRAHRTLGTALLALGITLNLAVLGFFKYTVFLLQSAASALGWVGAVVPLAPPSLVLPLGLSFFTFEFIHYLVDIRRGAVPLRSPLRFAVFAAFFPSQVAGPIKRFQDFVPQLDRLDDFDWARAGAGARLLVLGLFKKVALADNLAPLVELGFGPAAPGAAALSQDHAWLVVIAFALQIYFDFSGYTDMGRGSALLLGFTVPENFRRPYLATSPAEFWHRWHISLSTWLRDYLYIPLGGNRRRRDLNLLLTMALGGLWHGANWTFVIWGAFHGILLIAFAHLRVSWPRALGGRTLEWRLLERLTLWPLTLALVCIGWVFFRAETLTHALDMVGAMLGWAAGDRTVLSLVQRSFVMLVAVGCLAIEGVREWSEQPRRAPTATLPPRQQRRWAWATSLQPAGYALLFGLTILMQPSTSPRFIYFQF